ncbi:hypothetical protein [Cohnella sp. JJ-181]|uniref:hypothetical protein n=1 Tax=Cohnella rhizoplanae TaxID=2974897 RepID=UPI0022FF58C9|nr:hypothetical protein [Cohnella sp. JJ-181]CAI6084276.1 hypothetical protein COHCIP112018_04284 [Cohnella sp. JJ-181]
MKKKNRLKKWLIGIGCFLVILLAGAYFSINYAADKVMDKLSDSILESAKSSPGPSVVEGGTSSPSSSEAASSSPEPAKDAEPESKDQPPSSSSSTAEPSATSPASPDTAGGGKNSSENAGDDSEFSYSAEVSVDKAETVKEGITFAEKTKLMTIMLKRLDASDIKTLSDLAGGGLSVEKKKEAKKIILEKLSEKEYDELIKIAQKYGLSEGKSYEDSKKEKGMQQ